MMKKRLRGLTLFLSLLLIVTLTVVFSTESSADGEPIRPDKIDTKLWEVLNAADEKEWIPINISLQALDEKMLTEKVKAEIGMDPEIYRNEERFQKEIACKIKTVLEEKIGCERVQGVIQNEPFSQEELAAIRTAFSSELKTIIKNPDDIIEAIKADQPASVADYTILKVRQHFHSEKNKVLKEQQSARNEAFISAYVKTRNNEVVYASGYLSFLYIKATKADILYYAALAEVVSIQYDDPKDQITPT